MKEGGSCKHGGSSRSWRLRRWGWLVVALASAGSCGAPAYSQETAGLTSLRKPLEILRSNSTEIVQRSLMQEQLVSDLNSEIATLRQLSSAQRIDNEQLTTLLEEQQSDYRKLETAHDQSQRSHDATSKSWTSYLRRSEEEIRKAWKDSRRNRLAWQIGIPSGVVAGVVLGIVIGVVI